VASSRATRSTVPAAPLSGSGATPTCSGRIATWLAPSIASSGGGRGPRAVRSPEAGDERRLRALEHRRRGPDLADVPVTQHRDPVGEGASEGDPLFLATRERLGVAIGQLRNTQIREQAVRVAVDVGGEASLLALVTADSRERLSLTPGDPVVATFKATATRATPRE
jgi:molybdopterin-binding protein